MLERFDSLLLIKTVAALVFLLFAALIIGLFKLITGSYILGLALFLLIIWKLLKIFGIYVMYPGSSSYTKSDI
jgi:hypothetical protein